MRAMKMLAGGAVAAFALALAACGGGGSNLQPLAPAQTGTTTQTAQTAPLSLTVTRDTTTSSSTARSAEYIPASTQSIKLDVYVGSLAKPAANTAFTPPTGVTAFSSVCQNFPSGQNALTIGSTAPLGTDTVVITAYNVPCSGSLTTANIASQFVGTGAVTAAGGTVAQIFNSGNPVTLLPAATQSGTVLLAVTNGSTTTTPLASPSPVAFSAQNATVTVTATETNYAGSFTATSSNTSIATVSSGSAASPTGTSFTVTGVGAGTATITVTDGTNSSTLSVSLQPGALQVAWVNNGPTVPLPSPSPQVVAYGPASTPTAAPTAIAVAGQTLTFTATQTANTTGYTAALTGSNCTLNQTSSTTGSFTVTIPSTPVTGYNCSLAVTGLPISGTAQTITTPIAVAAAGSSVPLLWTPPGVTTQTTPPYNGNQGPLTIIAPGSAYAVNVYASQTNYIPSASGAFTATSFVHTVSLGGALYSPSTPCAIASVGSTTSTTGLFVLTGSTATSPVSLSCRLTVTGGNNVTSTIDVSLISLTGTVQ